jgi:ABC-2 type transport system ATP-binding protein
MIEVSSLYKNFEGFQALKDLNLNIEKSSIYGLVGVNGSGKTTVIKHLTGVLRQDSGTVRIDGEDVYDNEGIKRRVGYIPDDLYFYNNYNMKMYEKFYRRLHKRWNAERFAQMKAMFGLDERRRISKFSKGMQKQAAFIFVMSAMPDILILDEPIDGLDPVVRKMVMTKIVEDVSERGMTVLISSHNLKEMEGICDSIGIMRKGEVVIERNLDELKADIHKVQVAYPADVPQGVQKYKDKQLDVVQYESRGSVEILVIRGDEERITDGIRSFSPFVFDLLPLTLEEIFIYEMEGEYNDIVV